MCLNSPQGNYLILVQIRPHGIDHVAFPYATMLPRRRFLRCLWQQTVDV